MDRSKSRYGCDGLMSTNFLPYGVVLANSQTTSMVHMCSAASGGLQERVTLTTVLSENVVISHCNQSNLNMYV